MKRYVALWRETWWLWLAMLGVGCLLGAFVSFVFFVTIPICLFSFAYFGLMRYDDQGNPFGDGTS